MQVISCLSFTPKLIKSLAITKHCNDHFEEAVVHHFIPRKKDYKRKRIGCKNLRIDIEAHLRKIGVKIDSLFS